MYVATGYSASSVSAASDAGTIGNVTVKNNVMHFLYKGKDADTVLKSDYINVNNLDYLKVMGSKDLLTPLKSVEVTLDGDINSGAPIVGQDYVLGITFRQWIGMSDQDVYYKDVAVHVTSTIDTAKKLFDAMVVELNKAFSREVGATASSNPYLSFTAVAAVDAVPAKLVITEKPQEDYSIGTEAQERVYFDVNPTTVLSGSEDVIWGKVTDVTPAKYTYSTDHWIPNASLTAGTNALGNGVQIADLEHFCLGERGDQYRNVGWPNVVTTEGLANPTLQYIVVEIHHAFTDTGVNSYRGEKDITIVAPDNSAGKTALNAFITSLNSAAGTSVPTLT